MDQIIPYRIASPQTNPLRDRTVLLLCFCKLLLGPEGLVGLCSLYQHCIRSPREPWFCSQASSGSPEMLLEWMRDGVVVVCQTEERWVTSLKPP